ncbi:MAG: Protein-glutamate methylesterase [Massilia sp.]|nr:Protein-glutamate methylesterase [Massilia sp.]
MSRIVVIGGSLGAINALKVILASLPEDFPAAILIVTHIGSNRSMLPQILQKISALPVRHATDGEPITPGRVLLAPPDEHLTVVTAGERVYARLVHGAKENHCRPAIDPLFRSAAAAFGTGAIGVVLTGYLDDGTVGLQAVKARGGIAIVQDPAEAEAPDMPASALKHVGVDRKLGVREIGPALVELISASVPPSGVLHEHSAFGIPDWIDIENRLTGRDSDMNDLEQIGEPSSLTCPECHGALWEIRHSGPVRYRCHTGHAFTAKVLEALQSTAVEDAIWGAIRALHEQERLFSKMSEKALQSGNNESVAEYQAKAAQAQAHSKSLRDVIGTKALIVKHETI